MKISELSFSNLDPAQLVSQLIASPASVITAHAEMVFSAYRDIAYETPMKASNFLTVDGVGLIWGLAILGKKVKKCSGVDIVEEIIKFRPRLRIYIFGAKEDVAASAAKTMTKKGAEIVGYSSGYFYNESDVFTAIVKAKPQIVLVGIGGSEKQLVLVNKIRDELGISAVTVGGAIDLYAGVFKRAPKLVQAAGLEWLWRMIESPIKFMKLPKLMGFVGLVIRERLL